MRIWWSLLVLVGAVPVSAQESVTNLKKPDELVRDVELLVRTPLEGEGSVVDNDESARKALWGKPIRRVTAVDPPPGFDPVSAIRVPLGIPLSRQLARRAVLDLWETGKVRDVMLSAKPFGDDGVELLVEVRPLFRIGRVTITGNHALADAEVKRAIGFVPGVTVDPTKQAMFKLRDKLLKEYGARGYADASATLRLKTTSVAGEVSLVVEIEEGPPQRYTHISLIGVSDKHFAERMLRRAGLTSKIVRDERLVQERVDRLASAFFEAGYPDFQVGDQFRETLQAKRSYRLMIPVKTGLLTDVVFEGNRRLRSRDLRAEVVVENRFHTTPAGLRAVRDRVAKYAVSKGFLHNQINVKRRCERDGDHYTFRAMEQACPSGTKRQVIVITVSEGIFVEVVRVQVEGNHFFLEPYLRDEVLAFVTQAQVHDEGLGPVSSGAVNRAVAGYGKGRAAKEVRGTLLPPLGNDLIYDPKVYGEAAAHLRDVYAEQGFSEAIVQDTCQIGREKARTYLGRIYRPFLLTSASGDQGNLLSPCLFIDETMSRLLVLFRVKEGVQTTIRSLDVEGNTPDVFTKSRLLNEAALSVGGPYNEYYIRDGANKLKKLYQQNGYIFANAQWRAQVSYDKRSADVLLQVTEGPKVTVKDIIINAEVTRKGFIKENLGFEKGDLLTPDLLSKARSRVMALGIFDAATVQIQSPGTISDQKNVVVTVIERKPQYMELRGGVATEEGIRGGFEYGHRNVAGVALNYRLKFRVNYRDPDIWFIGSEAQQFKADLENRYAAYNDANPDDALPLKFRFFEWTILTGLSTANIPGTRGVLGTGVDLLFENLNRRGYSALRVTPRARLTSNYLKFMPVEWSAGIEGTVLLPSLDSETRNVAYGRLPSGKKVFFVSGLHVSFDFRDNPLDTRKGWLWSIKGEYVDSVDTIFSANGDVPEQSKYVRAQTNLSGYIPFGNSRNVLALSIGAGYIFHLVNNSVAWADRHFYMGGVSTLRGFATDALVPQDIYGKDWDQQSGSYDPAKIDPETGRYIEEYGGQAMFLLRSEVRHDFGANIIGVVFAEAGNLWRNEDLFLRKTDGSFAPWLLRPVGGLGFHYNTPVGPLAFDLGFNFNRREHETKTAWYFSIGSAF